MSILIDSHVHIYPHYDSAALIGAFRDRIRAAGAACGVMMLAEREGADAFTAWAGGALPPGHNVTRSDDTAIVLHQNGQPNVVVVGRQIACAERIEILALATSATFHDGIPAAKALEQAIAAKALPVLAWGVGKWLFKRAKTVNSILRSSMNETLFIGDPSLRPIFWPTPKLMAKAVSDFHRVLAGSDPLPPKTEETRVGQYADLATDAVFEFDLPLTAQVVAILSSGTLVRFGRRAGPIEFIRRMLGR